MSTNSEKVLIKKFMDLQNEKLREKRFNFKGENLELTFNGKFMLLKSSVQNEASVEKYCKDATILLKKSFLAMNKVGDSLDQKLKKLVDEKAPLHKMNSDRAIKGNIYKSQKLKEIMEKEVFEVQDSNGILSIKATLDYKKVKVSPQIKEKIPPRKFNSSFKNAYLELYRQIQEEQSILNGRAMDPTTTEQSLIPKSSREKANRVNKVSVEFVGENK